MVIWWFQLLVDKHPQGPVPIPPALVATENNIIPQDFDLLLNSDWMRSFPNASACGPSGLRIQHLLDAAEVHHLTPICLSLRELVCLLASGRVPIVEVTKFLAGESFIALLKDIPNGPQDIWPIAVGVVL